MSVKFESEYGEIEIKDDVIAKVVGQATTRNYGIIGMASKNQLKDGIQDILNIDNYSRGVKVQGEDDLVIVSVYIIVAYGTKVSEICRNVQSAVKYDLKKYLGITANVINVYVQGIRTDSKK